MPLISRRESAVRRPLTLSFFSILGLVTIVLSACPVMAVESELVGTWKVVSLVREYSDAGGATNSISVADVMGEVVFTPDGRYLVWVSTTGCAPTKPDEKGSRLDNESFVQSGRYEEIGDKLIQHIEISPNESLNGITRKQFIVWIDGKLQLESMLTKNVVDGTSEISFLTLQRVR